MYRIFVAIPISSKLQKAVLDWRESHSSFGAFSISSLPIRWLSGKNLHITLIPPWYEENPAPVIEKLQLIKNKISPFAAEFTKITYGPNPTKPRLIWASGTTPAQLTELQKELQKILQEGGFKIQSQNRPFLLHLTLARFREEDFHHFPIKILNETIFWQEKISSIVLMQSHLSQSGADYEILETVMLKKHLS